MPRRGSPDAKCTVVGCECEWIMVSKNRHLYCEEHMNQANALYKTYKEVCAQAIETFQDEPLDRGIELRQEYARKFLDYEDTGAHSAYITILQRVRALDSNPGLRRRMYNRWMTQSAYFSDFTCV